MRRSGALAGFLALALACAACSGGSNTSRSVASRTPNPGRASPAAPAAPAATPVPSPTAPSPPYYIESLRARQYPGGKLALGDQMSRGAGFTKYHMSWPSDGQTMTGTISLPDGDGPFPVVVVNHGYIPSERYWIGQDSGIFGDPRPRMASSRSPPTGRAMQGPGLPLWTCLTSSASWSPPSTWSARSTH